MIAPLAALLRLHEINVAASANGTGHGKKEAEVSRLLQALTPALHQRYVKTFKRHGENAVVAVERGVCMGCYTRQAARLTEIEESIYECQHCGRLIYLPDEALELYVG